MEFSDKIQEDIMEHLTLDKLVVELKEKIREKDTELQQKDEALQEERKAAAKKIKDLKLHAKAKINSLEKCIEAMKSQAATVEPIESHSMEQLPKHDKISKEEESEVEKIKQKLQEKEDLIRGLHDQLAQAQAEQASQLNKSSEEMEEFVMMKEKLQEKEEVIGLLQAQLNQAQAEQAAQLSSMQQVVREKDARFETQLRLHEDELLQLVTQSDVEAEMQQNLRQLQRKLEEHEEALLGRAQVVDLLQRELTTAEQQNQILSQKLQQMEAEHNTLSNILESERQESKILMEKMELDVSEKNSSLHNLKEEMQHLLEQLEQSAQAQAELQSRYKELESKHQIEVEEKTSHILSLQKTQQDLHSACDALKTENSKLLQEQHQQAESAQHLAQSMQQLEEQLQQKSEEIRQLLDRPVQQKFEIASQTSCPDVCNEGTQADTEEDTAFLRERIIELENEKGALLLTSRELEELKAENEKLSSQITLLEAQNKVAESDKEFSEILSQKLQQMEAEHNTLSNILESERQESKILMEKMELDVSEKNLSLHNLKEEMQHLLEQLEQSAQAQAELQSRYKELESKHQIEVEEKTSHILSLQKTQQDLHSACDALKTENSKLLQEQHQQAESAQHLAQSMQQLEEQLQQKSEEIRQLLDRPVQQKFEIASQTSCPDVCNKGTQADTEEDTAFLRERIIELENEKGALLLSSRELEELKAENEKLSSQITLLEAQNKVAESDKDVSEITMDDTGKLAKRSVSTEETEQDISENTFSQKHKELSVLLLEMREAQEEIAFLKLQLQGKRAEGDPDILDQKEMKQVESEGILLEDTRDHFSPMPDNEITLPESEKEEQMSTKHQSRTSKEIPLTDAGMELKSTKQDESDNPPSNISNISQCHQDDTAMSPEGLKNQNLELETSCGKMEEPYVRNLDEKKEISSLSQQSEEFENNAEKANNALSEEKDQPLTQVIELSVSTAQRVQVQDLEVNFPESESQRGLDCKNQTSHHNLLPEQIHNLSIEGKSQAVKLEDLQNELDNVHLQFSEQSELIKDLQSQLQKKESEVLEKEEYAKDILNKVEELSQNLSQKELEIEKMDQLLLEKKRDVQTLQQTIEEKDQQVKDINFSMTEKMVQLNEEKFYLGVEINTLKEQLNLLSRAEEKKEQVKKKEFFPELKQNSEALNSVGLIISKEELQHELQLVKRENELRKRQLRAALTHRKELLQRVSRLEEELANVKDESRSNISVNEIEKRTMEEDKEDSDNCMIPQYQEMEISLKQTLSKKEVDVEHLMEDLEGVAAQEQLQVVVQELSQKLKNKTDQIYLLQEELVEKQAVIQKLTLGDQNVGDGGLEVPVKETASMIMTEAGSGEHWQLELECKIKDLEKEKEQLQKKLQQVLVSRKMIIKKAQEKEKHLREELKQQKDDYNHLQEQFDMQSKEKENIEHQLRQLQIQIRESADRKGPGIGQQELGSPIQGLEEQLFKATKQQLAQPVSESSLCPDWPSHPGSANNLQDNNLISQIITKLKEVETEKEEVELKLSTTTCELTKKSEEVLQLQGQFKEQGLEIQSLKVAAQEAEAQVDSLRQKLDSCQLEINEFAHLRELQSELDELQKLIREKEQEVRFLSEQVSGKEAILTKMQAEVTEQEDLIKALHTQLEIQAKEHDKKIKQLQVELCEMQEKPDRIGEENKAKQQMQRKLQAALISRKETLKENKNLQEELSLARDTIEHLTKSLADAESQLLAAKKEKDIFVGKLTLLQEERDKLITEIDLSLVENKSLNGSCESLKLALEGLTEDKEKLLKEMESLTCSKVAESTEWQKKHQELQREYEILLQSYENVSNETERIQQTVRQEKQELNAKLRNAQTSKKETEKLLQEAGQEIEEMKEKMRKFAKAKQQKIIELEEENEQLRAEVSSGDGPSKDCIESLRTSNSSMKEELERVKIEYETLSNEFKVLITEKESLSEEVKDLKNQIEMNVSKSIHSDATEMHNQTNTIEGTTQSVPVEDNEPGSLNTSVKSEKLDSFPPENSTKPNISENISSHEISNYLQQIDQFKERIAELEEERQKGRECNQTLEKERDTLLTQITERERELNMLREEVIQINLLNQQIQEEFARVTKLKETAEEEKDDLEERLMNQLAELNGSIGNYYQDVTDAQIKNEQLESEMQNLKKCVDELEEEKQQLVKEKTQVESEIRKEYLEKIKGSQKEPVNKSHVEELQELLKEKQHEVKQLQKDCIRYQEKIGSLQSTMKALEFVQTESQKDLETTKEKLAEANEHCKKADKELACSKVLLDDTQSEAARVLADHLKLKKELQSIKKSVKSQMKQKEDLERRLEQEEEKHLEEKKNMQEKLDALHKEKVCLEKTFGEVQIILKQKDKDVKQLQEYLDTTVAQLAAFTKSMSSLQDDRVIDEVKKWERKFSEAIQTKEEEIGLKEEKCSVLKDQLKQMSFHMEELKINISRLAHDKQTWESKAQTEVQLQEKICDALHGEKKELLSQLEETRQLYHNSQSELAKWESECQILRDRSIDLNNSLEKCKEEKENLEKLIKQQEIYIQDCKLNYEQLETDLQGSKELINRLHEEINIKEQRIIGLLSAKEQAIQVAVTELHQQHDKEIKELTNLLSHEEGHSVLGEENKKTTHKTNQLTDALKAIQKENIQQKAQLNSFVKAMSSLQDDRDRIIGDYQKLEEKHLSVIVEKDELIQDAAAENNKLKEEIRCLRSHMDDLYSENAKLVAELIQYREDLNQVITSKDLQQKQLLEVQLQQSKELQSKYAKLEEKLKESEEAKEDLMRSSLVLQEEKKGLSKEIDNLQLSVSQLKRQVTALQEEGALGVFQAQLNTKEEEVQILNSKLSFSQKRIAELEEELIRVQKEATKKLGEVEEKLKKELKHLHHDAGIMRNETETAEERVAELARDLMEMEKKLLVVTKENKDLTAQIQSFGNSMNSLQNSRDKASEELGELKKKYDARMKELVQLRKQGFLNRERDTLVYRAAFPVHTMKKSNFPNLQKGNQQFLSKDEQLRYLSSQLEDSYNQVQSFSKAMNSLQNERDHLLNELEKYRKSEDGKQRSAAQSSMSRAEVQSLKKAMSSLQNDRDRLLKELKNLQQQYLKINQEIIELRPLKAQHQEYQDETKRFQILQEELRQENLSCQQELHQLRKEKDSWEIYERRMKEQYLKAISDKDQQLNHLQNLMSKLRASSSQIDTLKVQETLYTDVAPRATQEKNGIHRKSDPEDLGEPQERLEHSERDSACTPLISPHVTQEHPVIIDLTSNCQRTRSSARWKRFLQSLFHSRSRVPVLATIYVVMIHALLILCFTGHI
ncbi:golgin subfamily B member 1 [Suncus etruscus]|uniref:golgin subfamily B member 1 n=1 Tax=Suncus etruscus TaxID=109475 RepID=UPI00210FFC79|nr:golgin subfamily B member 1 [Suncus etruscus]